MLKFVNTFCAFFFSLCLYSQFKVIIIATIPNASGKESFYLAGNNNGWNPGDKKQQFLFVNQKDYSLTLLNVPANFEFKLTKGNWETTECKTDGSAIENRKYNFTKDTTIKITVENFQSSKSFTNKKSTASAQVKIVNDSFYIKKLNTYRRIWIYLPQKYDGKKSFPVLYMHDGQNLFDVTTAYSKEWGVDEYLDTAIKNCIVVGIDNGGTQRMAEYNFYSNAIEKNPKGTEYASFIVKELIPYINKNYQTKRNKANTFTAGSSMGGLISFLIGMEYPKTFGKIGIFSPSFWINMDAVKDKIKTSKKIRKQDFYFYSGMQESTNLVKEVETIYDLLKEKRPKSSLVTTSYSLGKHNEESWQKQLPAFFNWLLKD